MKKTILKIAMMSIKHHRVKVWSPLFMILCMSQVLNAQDITDYNILRTYV